MKLMKGYASKVACMIESTRMKNYEPILSWYSQPIRLLLSISIQHRVLSKGRPYQSSLLEYGGWVGGWMDEHAHSVEMRACKWWITRVSRYETWHGFLPKHNLSLFQKQYNYTLTLIMSHPPFHQKVWYKQGVTTW